MERLADIEVLALQCQSEQSKAYIAEAIQCYRAGAYRAAIVSTWIAVVFDLIDKIRELSLSGDGSAKELEKAYESYIDQIERSDPVGVKKALEFERNIIDACHQRLSFFDPQQLTELKRLHEDRNRCAHPSFQKIGVPYEPSAEQARLHIRNAIVHVLSSPPVQGKAALAELKTMVSSRYFPTEKNEAIQQLRESNFQNANSVLKRNFVDQLVFGFLTDGDVLFHKKQVFSALNAAKEMYPEEIEDRLRRQLNKIIRDAQDDDFTAAVALIARITCGWSLLEEARKEKVTKFVREAPDEDIFLVIPGLSNINSLEQDIRQRIHALEFTDIKTLVQYPESHTLLKEKVLSLLEDAKTLDDANRVLEQAVFPLFDELSPENIERIVRMPVEHGSALIGASKYGRFIEKVRESDTFSNQDLDSLLKETGADELASDVEQGEFADEF